MAILAQKRASDKRDVSEVASYRSARGRDLAERLESAAQESQSKLAFAVAHRLRLCADERNLWTGQDLHRIDDGEMFEGTGNLWNCGNRLCPSCSAAIARSSRKQARSAVARLGRGNWNHRWRSLVLTMPLMAGADVTDAIARINDAFRRLTNRQFWKSRIVGGIKSVEFTVRPEGYHAHIHLLLLADHIPVNREIERKFNGYSERRKLAPGNLQSEMKHCLTAAGAHVDGDVVVAVYDVKRQGQRHHNDQSITLEKALQETCKYLTKSESWDKIPDSQLVKVAEVERWPRMFELLGRARAGKSETGDVEATTLSEVEQQNSTSVGGASYVHTPSLSNGDLDGKDSPTWRQLLTQLDFDQWKRAQDFVIRRTQRFRRIQLALKFPWARFETLSGDGWSIQDVESFK